MILTTCDYVPNKKIKEVLGIVLGNTVRAKSFAKDFTAALKNLVGGELSEYTELLREARSQALFRMEEEAKKLGADAVINIRFVTASVMQGAAELLAYGTCVKLEDWFYDLKLFSKIAVRGTSK